MSNPRLPTAETWWHSVSEQADPPGRARRAHRARRSLSFPRPVSRELVTAGEVGAAPSPSVIYPGCFPPRHASPGLNTWWSTRPQPVRSLAVGLRDAARAVRPAAVQRRVRVVILPGEDADRVRVRVRPASRLPVARDLTGERSTRVSRPSQPPHRAGPQQTTSYSAMVSLPRVCAATTVERRAGLFRGCVVARSTNTPSAKESDLAAKEACQPARAREERYSSRPDRPEIFVVPRPHYARGAQRVRHGHARERVQPSTNEAGPGSHLEIGCV